MTTAAKASKGCVLSWNGQAVAEVIDLGSLDITTDFKETTNHDSPDDFKEKRPTLLEASPFTVKCNFIEGDTNGQQALLADQLSKTSRTLLITPPSGSSWTWTATCYVQKISLGGLSKDDTQLFDVSFMPTGKPVLAETASTGMSALTGVEQQGGASLTFNPTFAIGVFTYVSAVNTASTWVKLTPTAAAHTITITDDFDASTQVVTSGNQSGALALGAAGTVTRLTVKVQETGKVAKNYYLYVSRP